MPRIQKYFVGFRSYFVGFRNCFVGFRNYNRRIQKLFSSDSETNFVGNYFRRIAETTRRIQKLFFIGFSNYFRRIQKLFVGFRNYFRRKLVRAVGAGQAYALLILYLQHFCSNLFIGKNRITLLWENL